MRLTTGPVSIVPLSAALLGSFTLTPNAGQMPSVPTAVSGRVLAVDTGAALVNARVTLTGPNEFHAVTLTRVDAGGFTFASVPSGVYRLSAAKPGYVPTEFGAPGFGLAGALRVDGRPLSDIQIRLARGAAVSGHVLDPEGDPAIAQTVAAAWGGDESGRGAVAIVATRTDDLGEYRLGALPGGIIRIHIGGLPQPGRPPDRTGRAVEPRLVTLEPGEERSGVDFAMPRSLPPTLGYAAAARRPSTGVTVRGRVVNEAGRPIAGAQVMLLAPDAVPVAQIDVSDLVDPARVRPLRSAFADESGRYELSGISPGRYRVGARKYGYLPMGFDEPRSSESGRAITVGASDSVNDVDITLPRPGAVAGRVMDEAGNPVEGAMVTVVEARFEDGRRVLAQASAIGVRPSDDRGQYRVFGIEPGRYFVRAGAGDPYGLRFGVATGGEIPGYAASFFPGTLTVTQAAQVDVGPSSEVTGIDFSLVRAAMATVSGRVLTSEGQPFRDRLGIAPRS
jgi:protocatechuate 3,4-dioxygenase beta subunit